MALHTVSGLFQVTQHAWRHPAHLAHELALTAIQQARLLHSTVQSFAAQPDFSTAAAVAIQEATAASTAAGFEPYEQLVAKETFPDEIFTRSNTNFIANKLGWFVGNLLSREPAGTIVRLRALDRDQTLVGALSTAGTATLAHDKALIDKSVEEDSKRDNLLVFQTTRRQVWAKGMNALLIPGDVDLSVIDVDIFKVPKQLLRPYLGSSDRDTAATATPAVGATGDTSGSVQQEVTSAIQAGEAAGPFAVVGYAAVSQLMRDVTAARMALLQSSTSCDICCRVVRVPADSRPDYQQAALAAAVEQQNPPKYVFVVTVYPCATLPEAPRVDRVAAVAAAVTGSVAT